MIQANELMIGNFVLDEDGEILPVAAINSLDNTVFHREIGLGTGKLFSDIDTLKPVPLNKHFLHALLSPYKLPGSFTLKEDSMIRFAFVNNELICSIGDDDNGFIYNKVLYVHELQNLIFVLTKSLNR